MAILIIGVQLAVYADDSTANSKLGDDGTQKGQALFQRCGKCHSVPKAIDHTASEWSAILNKMGPMAAMTPNEQKFLLQYIKTLGRQGK